MKLLTILLIVLFMVGLMIGLIYWKHKEDFLDDYSLILTEEAHKRQKWWDLTHRKPFFYQRYNTMQTYRE